MNEKKQAKDVDMDLDGNIVAMTAKADKPEIPFLSQLTEEERIAIRVAEDRRKEAPNIESAVEPALSPLDEQVKLAQRDGLIPKGWSPFWGKVEEHQHLVQYLHKGYVPVKRRGDHIRVNEVILFIQPVEVARAKERAAENLSRERLKGAFPEVGKHPLHGDAIPRNPERPDAQKKSMAASD